MKLIQFLERWSGAIKGLLAGAVVYAVGGLAIVAYQMYWIAGGLVVVAVSGGGEKTISAVEQQVGGASEVWPLLAVGAIVFGLAVWVMEMIAQRLGPPSSD